MTTGEVADRASVNLQTVRFYERRGLLPEPPRSGVGHRQYDEGHVRRIRFIKRAQELGFSLDEIEELLSLQRNAEVSSREVRQRALAKVAEIEEKLRDLMRLRRTLEGLIVECSGNERAEHCSILHALDSAPPG